MLKEARDEQGLRIFETFSSNDMSSARDGWWEASLGQPQEQMIVGWSQEEEKGDGRSGRFFGKVRPGHSKN